jgi:DNA-binding MarR family transcriptional regulator
MEGLLARAGGATAEAARLVGDRDVLLVIDGNDTTSDGDHVSRATMNSLLAECPRLRILETARTARGWEQERTVQLGPLHTQDFTAFDGAHPAPPSPALAVLLDRIAVLRPGYRPDPADTAALREICSLLDELPRALESVACWLVLCPPDELVSMARTEPLLLAAPPGDPATGSWIDRALAQAVAELTPDQRTLLAQLSERGGHWTVEQMTQRLGLSRLSAAVAVQALLHQGLLRREHVERRIAFSVLNLVRAACPSLLPRASRPSHLSYSSHPSLHSQPSQRQEEAPHDGTDHCRDTRRFGTAAGVLRDRSRRDHAA